MLTRLEVHGFKNLVDVQVEFGAFTCIAGANGVGKSNVFDAIEFLSHLASEPLADAARRVRGPSGERGGDPRDLFWDGYREHDRVMRFAVEMIVPREAADDLGNTAVAAETFLRYELELGYIASTERGTAGRLALIKEDLTGIDQSDRLRFRQSAPFASTVLADRQRRGRYLATTSHGDVVVFHDTEDFARVAATGRANRTVLSTVIPGQPTVLAARQEMRSWRRLALEPSALRAPDGFSDPRQLGVDGRHLAATLYRIANDDDPDAAYARVADRLSDLAGVGVNEIGVDPDEVREVFTLFLTERSGLRLPARALSEGTLRFLALCVLLEDPTVTGLLCMEEPENGIHPANLSAMVGLVRELAVDTSLPPGDDNPFRQVIVNTHSPTVVQLCSADELLFAERVRQQAPDGTTTAGIALTPFQGSWRAKDGEAVATLADFVPYLATPPDTHLQLPTDLTR
ncbi:AAA family ATPase [Kutzneria buriramensis]|uniref:Putative ATPase n=1 Tax=Kutzneria buriramensis TaxID=1045776 RepID=A0A3E0IAE5_9PSEU|nr:AAA family ATPase [Kutzneria buriramensis]REH55698.1 putative ATPase [Kutzneria buriramensis]